MSNPIVTPIHRLCVFNTKQSWICLHLPLLLFQPKNRAHVRPRPLISSAGTIASVVQNDATPTVIVVTRRNVVLMAAPLNASNQFKQQQSFHQKVCVVPSHRAFAIDATTTMKTRVKKVVAAGTGVAASVSVPVAQPIQSLKQCLDRT